MESKIFAGLTFYNFNLPIIVLGDKYSISLAEIFIMAIHIIPGSIFVGETTWGATGPIRTTAIFNSRPFKVGNFMNVYTSSLEFKYIIDIIYEGIRFPPDIYVPFDQNKLYNGIDLQLQKAIKLF